MTLIAFVLALFAFTVAPAQAFQPQCQGLSIRHGDSLSIEPHVLYGTQATTVEILYHNPSGAPQSEIGWTRIPPYWWASQYGTPGVHAIALQVYEGPSLADTWLRSPNCLTYVEIH